MQHHPVIRVAGWGEQVTQQQEARVGAWGEQRLTFQRSSATSHCLVIVHSHLPRQTESSSQAETVHYGFAFKAFIVPWFG